MALEAREARSDDRLVEKPTPLRLSEELPAHLQHTLRKVGAPFRTTILTSPSASVIVRSDQELHRECVSVSRDKKWR